MHINITTSEAGNNRGSSGKLVSYLEKENRVQYEQNPLLPPEYWFNEQRQEIQPYEVRMNIDKNVAKLSRDEAKFFLINISPSEHELHFLKEEFGEDGAKRQLKSYANQVMDEYAKNFKKEYVKGNSDILYFGKVENHRYYTHKNDEVKQGLARRGEKKQGEQMHVQVIVSRKDITDSIRLSPLNNSRGKNVAHSLKVGQFDRSAFKQIAEKTFDRAFDYDREIWETFRYANTLKHGDYGQKLELLKAEQTEQKLRAQQKVEYERPNKLQQKKEQKQQQTQGFKF